MRRVLLTLGVAALLALGGDQALTGGAGVHDPSRRWDTRLRLFAVQPSLARDESRGGALRAKIPGFGEFGRPGDVYLPVKTVRIAIPDGTGPVHIEGVTGTPKHLPGMLLDRPAPSGLHYGTRGSRYRVLGKRAARTARGSSSPSSSAAAFAPPGQPVRMGDVGYMRDQRFVEVIYTPVVSPKGGGRALFYPDVDLDIVVEDVDPEAVHSDPAPADPQFEESYKRAFANYEQGRYFRRTPASGESATSAGTSSIPLESAQAGAAATPQGGVVSQMGSGSYPAYKLAVTRDGVYRLTQSYLLDPTTGKATGLTGADPRQFKIMNRGVEIPIYVQGESDGSFDPGDFIEFYGQRLDGPEAILNYDLSPSPSIYQLDDYGDENVYWLSVDSNGTRARVSTRSAPPNGGYTLATDFQDTIHSELDDLFQPTGGDDPFLMAPRLNDNGGSIPSTCTYTNPGIPSVANGNYLGPGFSDPNSPHYCPSCRVTLPGINASSATPATITVRMRGTTDDLSVDPDHATVVELNGVPSESTTACWSGLTFEAQTVSLAQNLLTDPLDIRIEEPGLADTTSFEQLLLDYTEVTYRRLFQAFNGGLKFTIPDANQRIGVSALPVNDPNQISLYEITNVEAPLAALGGPATIPLPVRITGGSITGPPANYTLTFSNDDDPNSTSDRTYVLATTGSSGFLTPDAVTEAQASTLLDPTREADILVIGDPNLMDQTSGSPFMTYWDHRAAVSGLNVQIISVDDIMDVFGYGIKHPEPLRSFLEYAYENWKGPLLDPNRPPPAFAALVGDFTADPKNNLNRSDWVDQVPSFLMLQASAILGFYASDNYIAAFHGADQVADIHLGRISVRTPAEADVVFTKLMNYESPPAGTWKGRGTFITDEGKVAGESSEFERITNEVIDNFWQPQPPFSANRLFYDDPNYNSGNDPIHFRDDIISSIDAGTGLLTYTGHGAFSIWGVDGFLDTSDVDLLTPNGKYFFAVNENCLAGGFHYLGGDALSEAFLKADDKGAVAFLAPAGLSYSFIGEYINYQIYGDIFSTKRVRNFGQLVTDVRLTLDALGSLTDEQSYTLIGDPTQNFALPAPKPPQNLLASPGNSEVTLSWNPSPDPNTVTQIYRATSPTGPYTLVNASPVGSSPFVDPNVINATVYYYYATSLDPDGFEGPATNFNTDCVPSNLPASGPDCVWAQPLNPNPPSMPAGAAVQGDGSGLRLTVSWNQNPENDIASYEVVYGTQQGGPYPFSATVNAYTFSTTLGGLTQGTPYYIRVMATNTSGLVSAPTAELTGIPLVFTGASPPEWITDLNIVVTPGDANSLTLSWSKPTQDIYSGPTTVASYDIYRGTTPAFIPGPSNLLVTISDPAQTTYIDQGAAVTPDNYYYLVGAKDTQGFESGLGRELPNGISDLTVDLINGGNTVRFDWSPITTDVHGGATSISKYVLYASSTPIPRSQVDSLIPLVDNIQTNFVEAAASPSQHYYTVIVVDTRGNKSPF